MSHNDTDRVIESLRQLADDIEQDHARIRDWEMKYVWGNDGGHGEVLDGKNVDIWVKYD